MAESVVLSYHDSLLRKSDVALLEQGAWLNDRLIGFYLEYLEYELYSGYVNQVVFVTPDVVQFIKLYNGAELGLFLEPLALSQKELVVLVVNNSASVDSAGGSHWSTLVYVRSENSFVHLDSLRPSNSQPAQLCAQRITPFVNACSPPAFREDTHCLQQENFSDCGIFALMFAEAVCSAHLKPDPPSSSSSSPPPPLPSTAVSREGVLGKREELKALIASLAAI